MKASRPWSATPAEANRSRESLADSLPVESVAVEPRTRGDEPGAFTRNASPAIEAPRLGGYRIAGDLEVRSKELEQELTELRDRYEKRGRELWRSRKRARRYKALAVATIASSKAGVGAALTSVVAMLFYFLDLVTAPPLLLGMVLAGGVVGVLLDARNIDEDDGFPPAPPPRMFY